ncbi:NAD(P)/FAD-dependent oxidoreductase [Nocardia sp. XZ_19_385]|uniref:NAD(P)/FAD-dependent oxidoreductase n=1 Tax=Nocardia sp. XZ_19_385 TaxID=2769488 RepID=UPI00188F2750|nr:FAD-dependent oxidoreductase [Nocardia sp. XZ_19_385]
MSPERHFIVVGGGLAAAKLAEALRANDFEGQITLIGAEEHLPYERPPLSKDHLFGKKDLADFVAAPGQWYRDHRIEVRLGTEVKAINRAAKTIVLPDDSTLSYDRLALATGSTPRRLELPGAEGPNVHQLRTIEDSDAILQLLSGTPKIGSLAIIGAGWIGLEVAAAARSAGVEVTIVESAKLPLLGALGPEMGEFFARLHRDNGVDLRFDAEVAEIDASGLRLADGATIAADAVLIAIGAAPNVGLAAAAGLDVDNGVLVDAGLTTSDPDIVAVGDIAAHDHPRLHRRIRVEHWANALNQPAVAAATMLGKSAEYDRLPYFFTDQYDVGMEYTGYASPGEYERVVVRGDQAEREFVAFWLDSQHRVLAGMNVNVWDVTDRIKELISSGAPVDPARLADTSLEL